MIDLYINIFCLSGEGEEREGLKYMLCTAELQNTAEVEDTDFNYEMRNLSHIYTNDIMPLPVSLTKICKFDLKDRLSPQAVMDLYKTVLDLHGYEQVLY